MPSKPNWLLHIPAILSQLRDLTFPIIDRRMCESLFGVGRRRAIELMQHFGGYRSGNTVLVDRLELIAKLEDLWASPQARGERKRKARLADRLESLRRARKAASVLIPVEPLGQTHRFPDLPERVSVSSGQLTVRFSRTEELLQRLFEVAQAAANDLDSFHALMEKNHQPCRPPPPKTSKPRSSRKKVTTCTTSASSTTAPRLFDVNPTSTAPSVNSLPATTRQLNSSGQQ
jgi:hypothetical protein